jgi:hypothetical protein
VGTWEPHDLYIDAVNMLLRSYGKMTVGRYRPTVTT